MEQSTIKRTASKKNHQARRKSLCIIREELMAIVDQDVVAAAILDRFLFWDGRGARGDGWIWKSGRELAEVDLMGMASGRTAQRRLNDLVDAGYLERRTNPDDPYDQTMQYRVNAGSVAKAVADAGYSLDGWTFNAPKEVGESIGHSDQPLGHCVQDPRHSVQSVTRGTNKSNNKGLSLRTHAKDSTDDPDPTPSPPTTIEKAREAFDDLDDIDALDQWIIQCCALFGVQMGIGAAMSLAKELTAEIEDPKKAKRYVRQRLTEMAGDVPPRSIRRYIMADARQWRIKDDEAPKPKSRGDLRGGEVIYSERGKRAFEEVEEYDWTFEILDDEDSEGGEQ